MKALIDKKSPIPIKEQLKKLIVQKIHRGEYSVGSKISSINEMSVLYCISRETIRQTLDQLVKDSYLIPEHGKGFFVKNRESQNIKIGILGRLDGVYIRPIYDGLMKSLSENVSTYLVDISVNENDIKQILENFSYHHSIDRLLVIPVRGEEESISKLLQPYRRYFKVAWLDRSPNKIKDAVFLCNYENCVKLAVDYSINKEIDKKNLYYYSRNKKDESVFSLMRDHFFELTGNSKDHFYSDWQAVLPMLDSKEDEQVSFLCETDIEASFLMNRLLAYDVEIPTRVQIIGVDNSDLCELTYPSLSSIDPGFFEIGQEVGKWLIKENDDLKDCVCYQASAKLILRESC